MKKLFLILLMIVTFYGLDVYAEGKTVFTVRGVEASAGSEVTVTINMSNNPNFELLSMKMPIDTSKLEFIDCNINGFKKAMLQECSMNPSNELIFYALTMYTDEKKLLTDTGNILDIRFKIKEDVSDNIPLNLSITDYGKTETDSLLYDVVNGEIKINKAVETKSVDSSENLGDEVKKKVLDDKVIWKSTDKDVATVDSEGNVEFRGNGNTTITAEDENGRILYEKTYLVNKSIPKKINGFAVVGTIMFVVLVGVILFVLFKRKKDKKLV